jgi:hypothetical protein
VTRLWFSTGEQHIPLIKSRLHHKSSQSDQANAEHPKHLSKLLHNTQKRVTVHHLAEEALNPANLGICPAKFFFTLLPLDPVPLTSALQRPPIDHQKLFATTSINPKLFASTLVRIRILFYKKPSILRLPFASTSEAHMV